MDAAPPHMQLARQPASNPLLHCTPAFLPPPQKPAVSATCSCGGRQRRGARAPHLPVEQARHRARAWSTVGDWSECTCQPALLRPIPDATPLLFHLAFLRSFLPLLAGFAWQPTNGNRRGAHRPWAHLLALGGRSVSKPLLPFVDRG